MTMLHSKHWFILLKLFSSSSKSYNYIKVRTFSMTRVFSMSGALECIPSSWFLSYQGATLNQNQCINLSFLWSPHFTSSSRLKPIKATSHVLHLLLANGSKIQMKKRTITEKDRKIEASFSNTTWNPWKFQFPVPSTLSPYRIPHKGPRWVWWPLSYHPTRPDGRLAPSSTVCRP